MSESYFHLQLTGALADVRLALKDLSKAVLPSPVWRGLKRVTGRDVRPVSDLGELDELIRLADEAYANSEEDGLRCVQSFRFEWKTPLPRDPYSSEYRDAQFAIYRHLSGRDNYSAEHEYSALDVKAGLESPYPYSTRSSKIVGEYLISLGFLLKNLPLRQGARIIEFGPGWGHTTEALVALGFDVTAVELDPGFAELLRLKLAGRSGSRIIEMDMLGFEMEQPADAALFFEAFHHCADHVAMLERLHRVVRPAGWLILAGEPIGEFEMPWGVRLDGQSVYAMRKHGWLELGFETSYFIETLRRFGWVPRRLRSSLAPAADVIIAQSVGPGNTK
jgi:SAM-dependent methyltransferase